MLLVYRFRFAFFGQEYTSYMLYLYNIAFTIMPYFYYLIARPELVGDIMVEDYKDYKLRYEHIKGIIAGVFITYISFSILPSIQINQLFLAVMINCTWMGNFYCLVIDDSVKKHWQIIIILVQCGVSIGSYFISLLVSPNYSLFNVDYAIYPEPGYMAMFYCLVFVFNPLLILMLFLFMSIHKSILIKDKKR